VVDAELFQSDHLMARFRQPPGRHRAYTAHANDKDSHSDPFHQQLSP
jgi:hypothetical protein